MPADVDTLLALGRLQEIVEGLVRSHEAYAKRLDMAREKLLQLEERIAE